MNQKSENSIRALVLEDNDERIRSFAKIFRDKKIVADFVINAENCVNLLETVKYDIIFLDHDLGGEVYVNFRDSNTGSEVARKINEKKIDLHGAIVIIHSFNEIGAEYMKQQIKGSKKVPGIWNEERFNRELKISDK
jgi:CheY-like chemotaxis protein